jgi:para-aminobenzoate synthetase component 1
VVQTKDLLNQWGKEKKPFVFLIDFECRKPLAWLFDDCPDDFKYNFQGVSNHNYSKAVRQFQFDKSPISIQEYAVKFNKVKEHISYGNSFLINLTCSTTINTDLSHQDIFEATSSKYRVWFKNHFVCFSPETFIRIKNGKIYSFPMKGTIDANIQDAKEIILNDPKEQAEHATIVDLLRNDLSMVSKNVRVLRYRYYEELKTQHGKIGQVSSEIAGELPDNFNACIGDIVFSLLPAGSVSGAPKKKTLEAIHEIEGIERGYYTGIAGYFDGEELDSCVLIRYVDDKNIFRSGGGVTFQSTLATEYQEMIDKIYVPIY